MGAKIYDNDEEPKKEAPKTETAAPAAETATAPAQEAATPETKPA